MTSPRHQTASKRPPRAVARRDLLRLAGTTFGLFGSGLGGAFLTACGGGSNGGSSPSPADPAISGPVALGLASSFSDLDPHKATGSASIAVNSFFVYQGLYDADPRMGPEGEFQPDLVDGALEQVDDVTYRAALRADATFHDGEPLTADDVVFSFMRLKDPALNSFFTPFFDFLESVTAEDERTVQFVFKYPVASPIPRLSIQAAKIMSRAHIEALGEEAVGLSPTGSGPYEVIAAESETQIELAGFPEYTGGHEPAFSEVNLEVIRDGNARVSALSSSQVHAIEMVPFQSVEQVRQTSGTSLEVLPSGAFSNVLFNCGKPPFDNKLVRQAFLYAIDRQAIIDAVYFGHGSSAKSLLPENHPHYSEPANVYTHNPETARSLLAQAGYGDGVDVELMISNDDVILPQGAIIQQNFGDVGIRLTLKPGDGASLFASVTDGSYQCYLTPGDLSLFSWEPDIMFGILYKGSWPKTATFWQNTATAEVEDLLNSAERSTSQEERKDIFKQIQDILSDEVPQWPVHFSHIATAWRDDLADFRPLSTRGFELSGARLETA